MSSLPPLTFEMRSNFRCLYRDVLFFGLLAGSTIAFLAIYAARQGASSLQISLLTAGPAVVNLMFSLPAGRWLECRPLVSASFWSSVLQRIGYVALIPLAWFLSPSKEVWGLVLITLVMSIPGTILAVAFNALLAEAVPPELRGQVVSRRNAIMALSQTTTAILCGQLLDRIVFPLNYQIVFGIGAAGALMSSYYVGQVRLRDGIHSKQVWQGAQVGIPRFLGGMSYPLGLRFLISRGIHLWGSRRPKASQPLLRLDLMSGSFGKFLLAYLLFYTFQYVPLPLFPLFYVHELHLTDGTISLGSALFFSLTTLTSLWLGSSASRLTSYRRQLVYGAILFGQYPWLIGLAKNSLLYLVACGSGGIVWAILNAGLINRLMERVPAEDRPAHMTLHNLVLNLGILCGSLAGPVLAGMVGLREAILISVALRLLGGVSLAIWA